MPPSIFGPRTGASNSNKYSMLNWKKLSMQHDIQTLCVVCMYILAMPLVENRSMGPVLI